MTQWVDDVRPSVLCCQETGATGLPDRLGYLQLLTAAGRVACWCDEHVRVEIISQAADWQRMSVNDFEIHNVYLSPYSSADRCARLSDLRKWLAPVGDNRVLVIGDFNLAPLPSDGWFGANQSRFTRQSERDEFERLLDVGLVDGLSEWTADEFTFQRTIRGRLSRFRCDLALISASLEAQPRHDHSTRSGQLAFTDHSAVIVDVPAWRLWRK